MHLVASNSELNQQIVSFKILEFSLKCTFYKIIVRGRRMINAYKTNILIPGPDRQCINQTSVRIEIHKIILLTRTEVS